MEDGLAMPEDVLIEILVNLPVKSLMRFACVSKYWCVLINSPHFVSRHLRRDCKEIALVKRTLPQPSQDGGREFLSFHDPDSPDSLVSSDLPIPHLSHKLFSSVFCDYMDTCNGLVCLGSRGKIILCNPALREFELLPPSPFVIPEGYVRSHLAMGFGYDATNDAYKIVQLAWIRNRLSDDFWVRIDLYNSSINSWRLIDAMVPRCTNHPGHNLLFNGACHWHTFFDTTDEGILSFDFSNEVFRQIEFPHFGDTKLTTLGVLKQCLAIVLYEGEADNRQFVEIWVMKEYGVKESWMKVSVTMSYAFNHPILLLKNDWLLMVTLDFGMAFCALHTNEVKILHCDGIDWIPHAVNYKESLVSWKKVISTGKKD